MAREFILVADDERDISELVEYNLTRSGFRVLCAASGEEALAVARQRAPDLIILDLMLPGVDGLDVCRALKSDPRTAGVPIIILSAKGEEADIVAGLELGADDYVTKPFSPRILVARVRAVLRKRQGGSLSDEEAVRRGDLTVDPGRREVRVGGRLVELTFTEFELLHFLIRRPGWVFTRNQIIDAVRGGDYPVTERSVDVQVVSLRRKLGPAGECVETVRGVGYRFKE
ncbi:MAG: Alkaline phosphatase synthesis transcriptional regulatory protein PhoP [Lentisphaerae bacterium ADurb.BinA184]|nr:MAG: Alkaline phosphatase synthesis transcriptional regulatory protein PhoP [Lentisphaerae bacterium ADurb.BinA184]